MAVTIYHNPRCSKSRQTLQLLQDRGEEIEIIEYLKAPPSEANLRNILALLGMKPRDLMRRKEKEYTDAGLDAPELSDTQLIEAMVAQPKLIERPIVVGNGKAALGRPPENALTVF